MAWDHAEAACLNPDFATEACPLNSPVAQRIERAYSEVGPRLTRFLVGRGCPPADADDLVQECFLRLFHHYSAGGDVNQVAAWLFRVARNLHLDRLGVQGPSLLPGDHWNALEATLGDSQPDPEQCLIDDERDRRLNAALARLTDRQLEYLLLRAEGLKYREIAEIVNVRIATVAEVCARALANLSEIWNEQELRP